MTIVVGVDGSEGSVEALRFALAEARLRDSDVQVVNAWQLPVVETAIIEPGLPPHPPHADLGDLTRRAEDAADAAVDGALEAVAAEIGGVRVDRVVVEGPAAPMLVEVAAEAELLIVGASGHRGVAGLLLGSVSRHVAEHAPCPVVIVPIPSRD